MKKTLYILLFTSFLFTLNAQNNEYDIILFNNVIGKGVFNRTVKSGIEKIDLLTEASAKVMFKQRDSYTKMDITLKNGVLQSLHQTKIDDGEKQIIKVVNEGGQLYHYRDELKTKVTKPVKYTTTHLFFLEPKNIKEVYVERFNEFVPVEKVEDNEYRTKVDGSYNYYKYANGKLVEYRAKNIVNVYMKPI